MTTALCVSGPAAAFASNTRANAQFEQTASMNLRSEDNVIIGDIPEAESEDPTDSTESTDTGDAEATVPDGLFTDDKGNIFYYEDGKPVTNTLKKITVDGSSYYYYFDENGMAYTDGLKKIKLKGVTYYYYFRENGRAYTDGYKKVVEGDSTNYYYFTSDGTAYTSGFKSVSINEKTQYFFFKKNGRAAKNKLKVILTDGSKYRYYFKSNGRAAKSSWQTIDNKTYYFDKNGRAVTGTKTISKYYCVFNKKGILQRKIDTQGKLIALTYDDGPSIYTPSILSTLKSNNAVATFFVVGNRVSTYSSYVNQAYEMGCEIGNHTYNHTILTSVSVSTINSEISKTNSAVKKVTGVSPVVMRPPGGGYNDTVKSNVGMPLILWSIDTRDWETRNASSTYSAIAGKVSSGDIVLMHDLYEATAEASKKVIPYLIDNGFQLVTVSELAACKSISLVKGTVYSSLR